MVRPGQTLKLGLKPYQADPQNRTLMLTHFVDRVELAKLPPVPPARNWGQHVRGWGMLGNDQVGDCGVAASMHLKMAVTAAATGTALSFTTANAIADYSAISGYDPRKPNSDVGVDMLALLKYGQQTGFADAHGKRHKFGIYAVVDPQDAALLRMAVDYLGGLLLGMALPAFVIDPNGNPRPWTMPSPMPHDGSAAPYSLGGHAVPVVEYSATRVPVITWGQSLPMGYDFLQKYVARDGAATARFPAGEPSCFVILDQEFLASGKAPNGLDVAGLQQAFKTVTA